MNPPLRGEIDRLALLEGVCDGTIDMIATDHAPHSVEEKSKGLKSLNGIVGLECAFPVLYTDLVKKGVITLDRLIEMMSIAPAERFGIKINGFSIFDLDNEFEIDPESFLSKGSCTPFGGKRVYGKTIASVCGGSLSYIDKDLKI